MDTLTDMDARVLAPDRKTTRMAAWGEGEAKHGDAKRLGIRGERRRHLFGCVDLFD